jgi:hypothetical protein
MQGVGQYQPELPEAGFRTPGGLDPVRHGSAGCLNVYRKSTVLSIAVVPALRAQAERRRTVFSPPDSVLS